MLVSLIIIFTHLVIQTSGQSCRSTALTGTGEELYSTYGNNSLSTFGDLDGNYTCPSQIITDATKFAQCSASVIIRGQFSLLGLIEAKCYRSPNASVIINGRIELGCCSSLVTNGIVVAANASLISLGVNSTFSLSYLSMEEGSKFLMGDLVDVKNGINEGHISIGSGSSMFINTELSTIRHTMEIDSAQVSLIDRSEMVLTDSAFHAYGFSFTVQNGTLRMNQSSLSFSPATTSIAASTVTLINESSLTANNAKVNIINSNLVMDRGYMDLSYSNFYVSESSWFLYNSYIRAYRLDMSVMGGSQMEFVNVDGSLDIVNITTSDSCSIQWTDSHVGTNNFGGAYNITMAPNSHLQISNTNFNPKSLGGLIVISLGKNSTFSLNSNGTIKKNCTLFLSFTVPDGVVYTEHDVEQSMICYDAETPDFTTTMESSDMTKTSEISLSTIYSTVLTSTSTKNSTISSTTYSTNEPVKSTSSASIGTTRSTSTKTTQPPSTRTSGLASTSTSGMASTSTSGMASTSTSEMASTSTSEMVSTSTNGMASTNYPLEAWAIPVAMMIPLVALLST